MKWIVDKLDEGFAEIEGEDGKLFTVPLSALPDGLKEKDIINIEIDKNATLDREKKIKSLMNDLFVD